jgi:hypothetical protein
MTFLLAFGAVSFGISAAIMGRATYLCFKDGDISSLGMALTSILAIWALLCVAALFKMGG